MILYILILIAVCLLIPTSFAAYRWGMVVWKHREKHARLRAMPTGLPTLPVLGHLHHYMFSKEDVMTTFIDTLKKSLSISEGSFCFWFGPIPTVFINRPEDIQVILNSSRTLEKSKDYDLIKFASGDGLVRAPVRVWKVTRRHVSALFHPRRLDTLVSYYNTNSQQAVERLSVCTGRPIDIIDIVYDLSMKNTYGLMFGPKVEVDIDSKDFKYMTNMLHRAVKLFSYRFLKPWLHLESVFRYLYRTDLENIDTFWDHLSDSAKKVIEENEKKLINNNENINKSDDANYEILNSSEPNNSKLDVDGSESTTLPEVYRVIRQKHPQFTAEDLRYEGHNLFSTGTDTTAVTLSSCLVALGRHPDIQDKLYNEIVDVLGNKKRAVDTEDLKKMTFMDSVFKETLRRFSVVPVLLRRNDVEVKLSDCTLPPQTTIAVSIMGLNMNPKEYPDPEKFDPERFSPENAEKRKRYAFIPFSGGPRDCIGKQYAWLSMKISLVHILRQFKIYSDVDINQMKFRFEVALVSVDGYRVTLERRG